MDAFKHFTIAIILIPVFSFGQINKDSLLASERSIDRPIFVHGKQLRITGGYGLHEIINRFDNSKNKIHLSDDGLSSIRHSLLLDLKYGLNEYLEFNMGVGHQNQAVKKQTVYIAADPEGIFEERFLSDYKGLEDLYIALNARAPLKTRKLDLGLTLGASLPTATYKPDQPSHSYEPTLTGGLIIHHDNFRWGKGVPVGIFGGMFKYRSKQFAISARADYRHGLKEGENIEWKYRLIRNQFEYRSEAYSFRLPDQLSGYVEFEYQAKPWIDLILNAHLERQSGGWTSAGNNNVSIADAGLFDITPGIEILITPRIWLRQRISFPVAGQNFDAPISFTTTMAYNFFPF